jgi:hypothetical protein
MFLNKARMWWSFLLLGFVLMPSPGVSAQAPAAASAAAQKPRLTVEQVVARLEERNRERASALRQFQGVRIYHMDYHGFFGHHEAEMVVDVNASPDDKKFKVVSEKGSKFVLNHVLEKLLEGEKEATNDENRRRTALDTDNYDFTLAGFEDSPQGGRYVLNVIPKTNNKYLYRGKIWVDAKDFAVCRIEAEPAKSPSFWVKKSEINHKYGKVGEFWLPEENHTESWIRFGGHALLTIEYKDYKITEAAPMNAVQVRHETVEADSIF